MDGNDILFKLESSWFVQFILWANCNGEFANFVEMLCYEVLCRNGTTMQYDI